MKAKCPFCERSQIADRVAFPGSTRRYQKETFDYGKCASCGSIVLLAETPPNYDNYITGATAPASWARRLNRLLSRLGATTESRILDYGCGNGKFVRALREKGFRSAEGYDPYSSAREPFIHTQPPSSAYSYVFLVHVFEHIQDFGHFLGELDALAAPGATVVTISPSATRFGALDPADPFQAYIVHAPFHTVVPSDRAVARLFENRSYSQIECIEYDVVKSGIGRSSRYCAVLRQARGGTKEDQYAATITGEAASFLRSPVVFLRTTVLDTRDRLVSTLVFRRNS